MLGDGEAAKGVTELRCSIGLVFKKLLLREKLPTLLRREMEFERFRDEDGIECTVGGGTGEDAVLMM